MKKLKDQERKQPMHIYLDEKTGQMIEELLSKDMAVSALMKQYKNPAKEIHKFMFGN